MKSTYTAIRCIMLDFWDHSQGECAASSDTAQQLELHTAELFAPRKLSLIDITEPRCIHLLGGGRICFLHAVRGEVVVSVDEQVSSTAVQSGQRSAGSRQSRCTNKTLLRQHSCMVQFSANGRVQFWTKCMDV
jgi:hypothetical protein